MSWHLMFCQEMGLPIHPALLHAHPPKVTPSVVVTTLLFSAWPWGQAVCVLGHSGTSAPFRDRAALWSHKQAAEAVPEFTLDFIAGQ